MNRNLMIINLLELNLAVMSQIPSVYKRTEEALSLARELQKKIDALHELLDSQKYQNDVLSVGQIERVLA